jgi:hypothetical protein
VSDFAGKMNSSFTAPGVDLCRFPQEMVASVSQNSGASGEIIEYLHIGIFFTFVGLRGFGSWGKMLGSWCGGSLEIGFINVSDQWCLSFVFHATQAAGTGTDCCVSTLGF